MQPLASGCWLVLILELPDCRFEALLVPQSVCLSLHLIVGFSDSADCCPFVIVQCFEHNC